jgi:hypothetical protein
MLTTSASFWNVWVDDFAADRHEHLDCCGRHRPAARFHRAVCLFAKRLERGRFIRPQAEKGVVCLSARATVDATGRHRLAATDPHQRGIG